MITKDKKLSIPAGAIETAVILLLSGIDTLLSIPAGAIETRALATNAAVYFVTFNTRRCD